MPGELPNRGGYQLETTANTAYALRGKGGDLRTYRDWMHPGGISELVRYTPRDPRRKRREWQEAARRAAESPRPRSGSPRPRRMVFRTSRRTRDQPLTTWHQPCV